MAVVQISRIQVRRGTIAGGTSLPQLASGELAWALDSQELWIGNGSVAEGAPAVGNTKILTLNDLSANGNILGLIQYIYKINEITSGTNGVTSRPIQQRLDDQVISSDFGTQGSGVPTYAPITNKLSYIPSSGIDDYASLQLALQQLYTQAPAAYTDSGVQKRYVLEVPPGVYVLTDTLYIPSYVTLRGAGSDKTIFYFYPTSNIDNPPALQIVNNSYFTATPTSVSDTNYPSNVIIEGLTIWTHYGTNTALLLDSTKDCLFQDIHFKGNADTPNTPDLNSIAVNMLAFSAVTTCQRNVFRDCKFENFTSMVVAKYDIRNNNWDNCFFQGSSVALFGILFGLAPDSTTANGTTTGQVYGPRENVIINCKFSNIKEQALFVYRGFGNVIENVRLINVGSNGGSLNSPIQFPQIYLNTVGNRATNVYSDRSVLVTDQTHLTTPFVPEVTGATNFVSFGETIVPIQQRDNEYLIFRLPLKTNGSGAPTGTIIYNIDYFYVSTHGSFSRKGILTVVADVINNKIQLSDEYDYAGINGLTDSLGLDFKAHFLDATGVLYTGALGQNISALGFYYTNSLTGDTGNLTFIYKSVS